MKNGTGTATISTANTITGSVTVNAGTLVLSGSNNLGTATVTVNGGALTLSGANTHTGTTALAGGTLNVNNASALGSSTLTITSTVFAGVELLRPVVDAFMQEHPTVAVRMYLLERPVNLIDEGMDLALRITHLGDSTLVAHRVGEARRVVVASPRYLAAHPRIDEPSDLSKHQIITMAHMGLDSWSFPPPQGSSIPRSISFAPPSRHSPAR